MSIARNLSTVDEVMDELNYRSYEAQRRRSPDVSPDRWVELYGEAVWDFERRYQGAQAWPPPYPAAEVMDGEMPAGHVSRNQLAGPTLTEVLADDAR